MNEDGVMMRLVVAVRETEKRMIFVSSGLNSQSQSLKAFNAQGSVSFSS